MQYTLLADDGNEYGPVDVPTLSQWAAQGRLAPASRLRDFQTSRITDAQSVPGIFAATAAAPVAPPPAMGVPYPRPTYTPTADNDSIMPFINVLARSVLGVVLFFVLHGIGLIFAGYALYYAIRVQASGSKYGVISLAVSGLALAAVGIGWIMRLTGQGV